MKPETPSWGVAVSDVPEMRQYMATASRANAYDGNISAINQEAFKNLLQSELDKVKQEVSHLSAHLHDQNVSALRPPPPLELGDSPRPMDPVPFPPSEETLKSIGGIFSSPSSVFYQAHQPETKSASSSSSSSFAKTRTSSRFGDPSSSFTRSHDQLTSPPAHNTRSRAKP